MAIGISELITWLTVILTLQMYTACPHCQQSEHLNNTVMAFFTDQGLTPKLNEKEPYLLRSSCLHTSTGLEDLTISLHSDAIAW